MPAGNGTGPMGQGAMTGRGAGFCSGNDGAGYENAPGRGGFGRRGGGYAGGGRRGNRNRFNATGLNRWQRGDMMSPAGETSGLQQQVDRLQSLINGLQAQLAKLRP